MNNPRTLTTILTAGSLCSVAFGQITLGKGGYLFRVKYTPGQVIQLDSTSSIDNILVGQKKQTVTVAAPLTLRVASVQKGIANVQVSIAAGMIKGMKTPITPAQTFVVKLDDHNRPTGGSVIQGMSPLPIKPMEPGAVWTSILPMRDASGLSQRMDATYRFAGVKNVNGHQVAVATYTLTGFAIGRGTMMLLTKDGSMFSNDTKISLKGSGGIEEVHTVVKRRI